jgi:hypothetical protein
VGNPGLEGLDEGFPPSDIAQRGEKMARNKRSLTVLLVAGAVVVLAGGLMASNMGFKLNRALVATSPPAQEGGGGSASGTQTLGLPYNPQVGLSTASDLFKDIGTTNVQRISRYRTEDDLFQVYQFAAPDFALAAGEGLLVKMGLDLEYIVVGSHDPGAVIQLESTNPGVSASGSQLYAPPYHGTASSAKELFQELGTTNVQRISKYLTETDLYQVYQFAAPDFPLVPGEAYLVKMGVTLAYSPSHY